MSGGRRWHAPSHANPTDLPRRRGVRRGPDPARCRAGPARRDRRAAVHQLRSEHPVLRVARAGPAHRRLPGPVPLLREQRRGRRPRPSTTARAPATRGPTGPAWPTSSTAASTASAPRAATRSPTTRSSSPTARTRARWARRSAAAPTRRSTAPSRPPRSRSAAAPQYTKDAKVALKVDFSDDVAGPFPANFLCFQYGGGPSGLCDAAKGFIYGYNAACSVPGGRRQVDELHLHRRLRLGRQPAPDGAVWACVRAADAAIPDNPSSSNQSAVRREGQPVRPAVRRRRARPRRPGRVDQRVRDVGQGRRPRHLPGAGDRRHLGRGRPAAPGPGATTPRRQRRRGDPHVHAGRHLRGPPRRRRQRRQRRHGDQGDHRHGAEHGGTTPGGGTTTPGGGRPRRAAARPRRATTARPGGADDDDPARQARRSARASSPRRPGRSASR